MNSKYYWEHKEEHLKAVAKWAAKNPEKVRKMKRDSYLRGVKSGYYRYYKISEKARRKGIPCNWSRDDFTGWYNGQEKVCYYCRCVLTLESPKLPTHETFDRMDNSKGYERGNIALCCLRCNNVKGAWIPPELMKKIASKYLINGVKTNRPNMPIL